MLLQDVFTLTNIIQVQNGDPNTVVPSVSQGAEVTQVKNIQINPTQAVLTVAKQETSTTQPKPAKPQTDAAVVKTEEGILDFCYYTSGQFVLVFFLVNKFYCATSLDFRLNLLRWLV